MRITIIFQNNGKTNQILLMINFQSLNRKLTLNPYQMTKMCEMLLKLEGFQYDKALYLISGYQHILYQ